MDVAKALEQDAEDTWELNGDTARFELNDDRVKKLDKLLGRIKSNKYKLNNYKYWDDEPRLSFGYMVSSFQSSAEWWALDEAWQAEIQTEEGVAFTSSVKAAMRCWENDVRIEGPYIGNFWTFANNNKRYLEMLINGDRTGLIKFLLAD